MTAPDIASDVSERLTRPLRDDTVKIPARRRRSKAGRRVNWWFIVPALVAYAFVVLVPSARGLGYSFTDWNGIRPVLQWVGFDNYIAAFNDQAARDSLLNTAFFAIVVTILQNAIGLLLALGVNSIIKSRYVLRVLLFAPAVLTPVVTSYVWKFLYAPEGPINGLLGSVGLSGLQQDWLGNPDVARWSIVAVIVWQNAGYSMVIFLAGLQGIPEDVYEAAAIDGAGSTRTFWSITRPLLAPAITINLMLSIIGGLKLFDQVQVLTGGGPGTATATMSTTIVKVGSLYGEYAYSLALAVLLSIGVAIVSGIQYRLLSRQEKM